MSRNPILHRSPAATEIGLTTTYLVMDKLSNSPCDPRLDDVRQQCCEHVRAKCLDYNFPEDIVISGYRQIRERIGRSWRKYPCSTEALISVVLRTGTIPQINRIVDIYNIVSLETYLTIGAHDVNQFAGDITLKLASGDETFIPLGADSPSKVASGDYCYFDDNDDVLCRLDYRQADKSKVTLDTTHCLFIIQGNPNTSAELLQHASNRLEELLATYCR